jgi:hypothetical protein
MQLLLRSHPRLPHCWLSEKRLIDAGQLILPLDIRNLIEEIYSHDGREMPVGPLLDPETTTRIQGKLVAVRPKNGYLTTADSWLPETAFPTRLGDASRIVVMLDDNDQPITGSMPGSAIRLDDRWGSNVDYGERDGWTTVRLSTGTYTKECGLRLS